MKEEKVVEKDEQRRKNAEREMEDMESLGREFAVWTGELEAPLYRV